MENLKMLERHFNRIGARLSVLETVGATGVSMGFQLGIETDRRGEHFVARIGEPVIELTVLQMLPNEKHLLLLVKAIDLNGELIRTKFLCGHDERHWFVAGVKREATDVASAKESLKPDFVKARQSQAAVKTRNRHRRRNEAFVRQGEWFFVPEPNFNPGVAPILQHEPIRRGRGKPHMVEELCRNGGTTVYVCRQHWQGLTEVEYRNVLRADPAAKTWTWSVMRRDMDVYARGRVTHSDHKTVTLHGWHRVFLSEEVTSNNGQFVRSTFLD